MRISKTHKIEKICSKDKSRLSCLEHPYLKQKDDGTWELQATDGYRLVRIPVEVDESDTEGSIPVNAFKSKIPANTTERTISANGVATYGSENGQTITEDRPVAEKWPDFDRITPDRATNFDNAETTVSFNAKMLYELAQALGSNIVKISINGPFQPIGVKAQYGESYGLLMPVRPR